MKIYLKQCNLQLIFNFFHITKYEVDFFIIIIHEPHIDVIKKISVA